MPSVEPNPYAAPDPMDAAKHAESRWRRVRASLSLALFFFGLILLAMSYVVWLLLVARADATDFFPNLRGVGTAYLVGITAMVIAGFLLPREPMPKRPRWLRFLNYERPGESRLRLSLRVILFFFGAVTVAKGLSGVVWFSLLVVLTRDAQQRNNWITKLPEAAVAIAIGAALLFFAYLLWPPAPVEPPDNPTPD
ncbi:MAG: hypothetical protein K1X71_14495 [Pirellulales bacterium]|nr:hypothetical protein [Pirellulales bacterium]